MKFSIQLFLSSLDDNFSREKRKITIFSFQMGYLRKLILSFGKFARREELLLMIYNDVSQLIIGFDIFVPPAPFFSFSKFRHTSL